LVVTVMVPPPMMVSAIFLADSLLRVMPCFLPIRSTSDWAWFVVRVLMWLARRLSSASNALAGFSAASVRSRSRFFWLSPVILNSNIGVALLPGVLARRSCVRRVCAGCDISWWLARRRTRLGGEPATSSLDRSGPGRQRRPSNLGRCGIRRGGRGFSGAFGLALLFGSFMGAFVLDVANGQPRTDGQPGGLGSRVEGRRKEVRLGNPVERQSNGFVTLSMHDCERSPPIRSATG